MELAEDLIEKAKHESVSRGGLSESLCALGQRGLHLVGKRVLGLMRVHDLLSRAGWRRPNGDPANAGTITTRAAPDEIVAHWLVPRWRMPEEQRMCRILVTTSTDFSP